MNWEVTPTDFSRERWQVLLSFLPRSARTRRSRGRSPWPSDVVILEGWGHPDPPKGKASASIAMVPGSERFTPDPVFADFLSKYLAESGAKVLADFREADGLAGRLGHDRLPANGISAEADER